MNNFYSDRFITKRFFLLLTMLVGLLFASFSSHALFKREVVWATEADAADTMLNQVNNKVSKKPKWFKKSYFPEPLDKQLKQKPLPENISKYLSLNISLVDAPELTAYLQSIVDKLLPAWKGPLVPVSVLVDVNKDKMIRVDQYNQIIISTAFIEAAKSEDYLATLLAHELAHIILLHSQGKAVYMQKIPELFEAAGGMSLLNEDFKEIQDGKRDQKAIDRTATHTATAGWIWTDMMAPLHSRSNEQEADYLALDLVLAANYNKDVGFKAFEDLDKMEQLLSKRMEFLKQMLLDKIAQREKMREQGLTEEEQDKMVGVADSAIGNALDAAFTKVAQLRDEHLHPEERRDNAAAYIRKFYEDDDKFGTTNSDKVSKLKKLKVMRSAAEAINAQKNIVSNNTRAALDFSSRAVSLDNSSIFSWSVRYVAREKEGNLDKARQGLEAAIKYPLAHMSMYIKLAEYYLRSKQGADAEKTLLQGQSRLGPKEDLYVYLIQSALTQGDSAKAEQYKKQCLATNRGFMKTIINRARSAIDQNGGEQPCVDVIAQAGGQSPAVAAANGSGQKSAQGESKMANAFDSALNRVGALFNK